MAAAAPATIANTGKIAISAGGILDLYSSNSISAGIGFGSGGVGPHGGLALIHIQAGWFAAPPKGSDYPAPKARAALVEAPTVL